MNLFLRKLIDRDGRIILRSAVFDYEYTIFTLERCAASDLKVIVFFLGLLSLWYRRVSCLQLNLTWKGH